MSREIPDIDIDVKNRDKVVSLFPNAIKASQIHQKKMQPHNSGLYFQKVPVDPTSGICSFPYEEAEEYGYFKVDILTNHVYDMIDTPAEYELLKRAKIDWGWFVDRKFYINPNSHYRLYQLGNYHNLVTHYPPQSIEDIAILIALIRPRKSHLIGEPWKEIVKKIWDTNEGDKKKYFFKKSHAIAFALVVTIHAKIIARKLELR